METVRKEKMQVRERVVRPEALCFPMFCGSGGSKSRLAKAAGAETPGQMRNEKLHAVVARSKHVGFGRLLEVEMLKKCAPLWKHMWK